MRKSTAAALLLMAAVVGCEPRSPTEGGVKPADIGRRIMESVAEGLGEDLSELRILAGSWDIIAQDGRSEFAAALAAYAKESGTAITCPGGDPHYCWTGGRPWDEVHRPWGNLESHRPRTMPQVIDFSTPFLGLGSFPYRRRQADGDHYSHLAQYYAIDAERLENGDWRIGELKNRGVTSAW